MTLGAAQHRTSAEANGPALPPGKDAMKFADNARQGSATLLDALHTEFLVLAMTYGVTLNDARLLCMNSWGKR